MEQKTIVKHSAKYVLTAVAAMLFFTSCGSNETGNKEADIKVPVKTERVSSTSLENNVSFSGNIEGSTTVKLGFMVPGKINQISASVGQVVSKGQLIASLDPTNYALGKKLADVQLAEVTDEFTRLNLLHSRGSLSESDFSKISSALQKAQVQQKLEIKNLKDTRLTSPIGGVLLSKQAELGEIIATGTQLFVVSDIKKVKVLAFVPEGELKGLRIGQKAKVNINALGKSFEGKITEVGAVADAASRAFTVKIELENIGMSIRPGMVAEAEIAAGGLKAGILLPAESIINDLGNQSFVYVIDNTNHKAFKRRVSLGKMYANRIEIISGISTGEEVVISGQTKLSDGSPVKIEK